MLQRQFFRLGSAIVLSGMLSWSQAVELGEPLVRSHLGQPLSADIELTGMSSEAASVQAALADPEVYRGASISMDPALSALNITILRRDGKRFLHLASPRAIESEHVHLFFTLTDNGRSAVRGTTLWFTPDPNPPAAPAAPTIACAPRFADARIAACSALDTKNAALSERIVELEEKVRVLTIAMQAPVEPAPARAVLKPAPLKAAPATPAPVQPARPAAATPWLFIGIAGALMAALIGALVYVLLRKRKGEGTAKAAAGLKARALIVSVRDRLLPAKKTSPETELAAE
jgi:Tfp pilus assembly protein FimV